MKTCSNCFHELPAGASKPLCRACWQDKAVRIRYWDASRSRRRRSVASLAPCKHCASVIPGYRPRGLCYRCYNTAGIRVLHAPEHAVSYPIGGDFYGLGSKPKPQRRYFRPGSARRLVVLRARAKQGQQLFCAGDYQGGDE